MERNWKQNQSILDWQFISKPNKRMAKSPWCEIYKHEPKIDEQQLNDVVQSYINRIIFLRVCEDRKFGLPNAFKFANTNDFNALIKKFEQADKRYNSGLFDHLLKDKL